MSPPSGFGLQYEMRFAALPIANEQLYYRVRFYRKGYTGTITDLQAGKTPWKESITEGLDGVKAKRISIDVVGNAVDLRSFYTSDDREVMVDLEYLQSGTEWVLKTRGWLNPFDASEPYVEPPYTFTLGATCGLGSLVDFPFTIYPTGKRFPAPISVHEMIYTCLSWVGYDLRLRSWTDRYEESMLVGGNPPDSSVDPLKITLVDPLRWRREDEQFEDCYTVLDDLCNAYGLTIVQDKGRWCVLSREGRTAPQQWHHYENPPYTQPQVVIANEDYYISKNDELRWVRGASVKMNPPRRRIELDFDYGTTRNLLYNGDFAQLGTGWTVSQADFPVAFEGDGSVDDPFRVKISGRATDTRANQGTPSLLATIEVQRGSRVISSTSRALGATYIKWDVHLLKLSGIFVNTEVAAGRVGLYVVAEGLLYSLSKENTWKKGYALPISYDNTWNLDGVVHAKPTSGNKFEMFSEPVPGKGNYTIYVSLWAGSSFVPPRNGGEVTYRDLKLSLIDGNLIPLEGEQWVAQLGNNPLDRKRTEKLSLKVGDQISLLNTYGGQEKRAGALMKFDLTHTKKWHHAGVNDRFQKLTARSRLAWMAGRLRMVQGTLVRVSYVDDPGPLATYHANDLTPAFTGIATAWEWEPKMRQVAVTLHEKPGTLTGDSYRGNYRNPEGALLPIAEPVGEATNIPPPELATPRQNSGVATNTPGRFLKLKLRITRR